VYSLAKKSNSSSGNVFQNFNAFSQIAVNVASPLISAHVLPSIDNNSASEASQPNAATTQAAVCDVKYEP
jgi:hypothetical protein